MDFRYLGALYPQDGGHDRNDHNQRAPSTAPTVAANAVVGDVVPNSGHAHSSLAISNIQRCARDAELVSALWSRPRTSLRGSSPRALTWRRCEAAADFGLAAASSVHFTFEHSALHLVPLPGALYPLPWGSRKRCTLHDHIECVQLLVGKLVQIAIDFEVDCLEWPALAAIGERKAAEMRATAGTFASFMMAASASMASCASSRAAALTSSKSCLLLIVWAVSGGRQGCRLSQA
jgi:hypothetical protein